MEDDTYTSEILSTAGPETDFLAQLPDYVDDNDCGSDAEFETTATDGRMP